MERQFRMVSDRYGEPHLTNPEEFEDDCRDLGWEVRLTVHYGPDGDYYTDEYGEVVLEEA